MEAHTEHNLLEKRQRALTQQFPQHTSTFSNRLFSYRTAGEGTQTIVMLHGIGSSAASWFDTAILLQSDARIIAWDAPGYGRTTPLGITQPKATDYAEALHILLEGLGIENCMLVGHSLGALMGAAYTSRYASPGQIRHFTLISPAHGYGGTPPENTQAETIRSKRLSIVDTLGIEGMARARAGRLVSPRASRIAQEWVHWNMACLHADGYRQAVELLCGDDIMHYTQHHIPVSVYCSEADDITPPESCREIAAGYGTTLSMIPHAGHASPVEVPDEIAALLQKELLGLQGR